jgi:hypothetical protein
MFGRKSKNQNELDAPPIANTDSNATEILRAWASNQGLYISLRSETWEDSAAWGIAIADIIRHLADAYEITQSVEKPVTIERILSLVHAELDAPTDTPTGKFVN